MMGWQWHQLDHMHIICTSLRQITTPVPHHSVFTGQMPFLPPDQQHQNTEGTRACITLSLLLLLLLFYGHYTGQPGLAGNPS